MFRTFAAVTSLFVLTLTLSAADWPQWRGPNRDGLSQDTGLLAEWPTGGPKLLWEAKGCGRGYATVAIANGKIYTMGDGPSTASDKDEYILCFDDETGKQIWKSKLGPAYSELKTESWQSSRSTPTVDGDLLYALTPSGSLVCMETAGGKIRWRKSMQGDFGGKKGDNWGYSESPLIDGDKLVCTPGGMDAAMIALNKRTGAVIWKAAVPKMKGAGHASIVIAEVGSVRIYVQSTASGGIGVNAKDGKVLWTYPYGAIAVIPTPIVRGDYVFLDAGYGTGGALLKLVPTNGGVKAEEVYGLNKDLANKHGGVLLVGDCLYGGSEDKEPVFCADFMTGKQRWKKRGSGNGSAGLGYADGNLYIHFANGQMVLAKASPDDYKEISAFKVPHSGDRPSWSHPVICNGKLYVREQDWLMCYDVRQK